MQRVEQHPYSFVILALATGVAAGALMRFRFARRALKYYLIFRRLV